MSVKIQSERPPHLVKGDERRRGSRRVVEISLADGKSQSKAISAAGVRAEKRKLCRDRNYNNNNTSSSGGGGNSVFVSPWKEKKKIDSAQHWLFDPGADCVP